LIKFRTSSSPRTIVMMDEGVIVADAKLLEVHGLEKP
jgi:hypothetical protein